MAFKSHNTLTGDYMRISNKATIKELEVTDTVKLGKLDTLFGQVTYAPKVKDATAAVSGGAAAVLVTQFENGNSSFYGTGTTTATSSLAEGELVYVRPYLFWDTTVLKTMEGYFLVLNSNKGLDFDAVNQKVKVA